MRILGILDTLNGPGGAYDLRKDTSHLLLLEFHRRGHNVYLTDPGGLSVEEGSVFVVCQKISVLEGAPYFDAGRPERKPASDFRLILMRKDPPVDAAYLQATRLLAMAPKGTWVCNHPDALARWNEKLVILQFPRWIPPTIVSAEEPVLKEFARKLGGKIVLKVLTGFGGRGTHLAETDSPFWPQTVTTLTKDGREPLMAQAFLPEIARGDKRIFLFDGKPLGALLRIPAADGFLANPDLGASIRPSALSAKEKRLCADLAPFLRKNGIFFAGIDVIGEKLTEINITSPGMLWEWNEVDGTAHEKAIVDLFERKLRRS
ncbi:MAG TPA: glutathione synthase [bacterium]|nr:glutathione synthase [bacterium]